MGNEKSSNVLSQETVEFIGKIVKKVNANDKDKMKEFLHEIANSSTEEIKRRITKNNYSDMLRVLRFDVKPHTVEKIFTMLKGKIETLPKEYTDLISTRGLNPSKIAQAFETVRNSENFETFLTNSKNSRHNSVKLLYKIFELLLPVEKYQNDRSTLSVLIQKLHPTI